MLKHQLLRNASSMSGLSILPTGHTGIPCASMLRQHVRGVIHKSPGRPRLEATLHAGERPSCVGPEQSALAEGDACAGQINQGADMLSRNNISLEEWTLHRLTVQKILEIFCEARVDLFASKDNSHCPIFFTRSTDALAHKRPSLPLYAFPRITLLLQVLRRVRERRHKLLLIAPLWRNQPWVPELFQLLTAAPWPIPLIQDLLSQAKGTIWHPRPELWALHVWPLDGSLSAPLSVS